MKQEAIPFPRIPVSTYRLQFNYLFRFSDAKEVVHYLHDLGISDIYASPYFKAKKESIHGYDIVDYNSLNPEIGSGAEYDALAGELAKYEIGQVLDIVPNHMCITDSDNAWWMDVLENGPSSLYARFFDIDWNPVKSELRNKVLLPVLGDQYGRVLEDGDLKLIFAEGAFFIEYYDHRLPVRPQTYTLILRHRLTELEKLLRPENPNFIELLSIVTALGNLPPYTESDTGKTRERYREKEVIKKRLWNLYTESPEIGAFIHENVVILNGERGDPGSFDLLDNLLREQVYRLSFWRVAADEINYRRFFDINELGATRMENPVIYRRAHELLFKLVREGKVTGLRVDHPDGLYDPPEYFRWLQRDCFVQMRLAHLDKLRRDIPLRSYEEIKEESLLTAADTDSAAELRKQYEEMALKEPLIKPFYIVAEKILVRGERMPENWPIYSTTGYVFLNSLGGIFVRTDHAKAFDALYAGFTRSRMRYQDIVYEKKKLIMQVAMSSEIHTLGHYLNRISERNRHTRDFTLNSLIAAIVEVIAFFPVYRTYVSGSGIDDRDRRYIELAVSKAKRNNPAVSESIFDFLRDVLVLHYPERLGMEEKNEWLDFVMRFQQISGPVMAKGVEDTAFYTYNRLVSLNEVGGSPERFGTPLETFHGQNMERIKFWPHALITTSTHDSKRSEDVRARINVLSEIPEEWREHLRRWSRVNKKKKPALEGQRVPDRNEEYLLYQTLVGAWPVEVMDDPAYEIFRRRIREYMVKALREAKVATSWINPNTLYEDAVGTFIEGILRRAADNEFLEDFLSFQKRISHCGMFNSLSQTLLKITSPGVPDFYQGTEVWDFSLVDPDNRRPVDYGKRSAMLEELKSLASENAEEVSRRLAENKEDGRVKLYLVYKALNFRKGKRELFERGEYLPLEVMGTKAAHVCAFARRTGNAEAVVVAPRFFAVLVSGNDVLPFGGEIWENSFIAIPYAEIGARYRNIFTEEIITVKEQSESHALLLNEVFSSFPVAVLERDGW